MQIRRVHRDRKNFDIQKHYSQVTAALFYKRIRKNSECLPGNSGRSSRSCNSAIAWLKGYGIRTSGFFRHWSLVIDNESTHLKDHDQISPVTASP